MAERSLISTAIFTIVLDLMIPKFFTEREATVEFRGIAFQQPWESLFEPKP